LSVKLLETDGDTAPTLDWMPAKKSLQPSETVGDRIRQIRRAKGLTQADLAQHVGISRRAAVYYEAEGGSPSADLLARYAQALGVTTDVLAGLKAPPKSVSTEQPESLRLWRRLKRIESLPIHDRKAILKMIDAMTERVGRRKAS
jgi:transcriptional regulator with XRE-family HTH domain